MDGTQVRTQIIRYFQNGKKKIVHTTQIKHKRGMMTEFSHFFSFHQMMRSRVNFNIAFGARIFVFVCVRLKNDSANLQMRTAAVLFLRSNKFSKKLIQLKIII